MQLVQLPKQKGAATVLMSVLVGFSITAMALALMFNVQNAQDKQVTVQAQVSTQNLAWAGSETFRQLLANLPLGIIDALPIGEPLTALDKTNVANLQGSLTPTIVDRRVVAAANGLARHNQITVNLASVNPTAGAGTTLQMVYGIFNFPAAALPNLDPVTFYHDTDLEGTVNYRNVPAAGEILTVKGSVSLTSAVTGINKVQATGNVTINNPGVTLKEVIANGTVTLSGDGKVLEKLTGLAGVNINQGFAGSVLSNGNVSYRTGAPPMGYTSGVGLVQARGTVSVTNQNNLTFTEINGLSTVALTGCGATACFKRVEAVGNLTAFAPTLDTAYSRTRITCSPPPPGVFGTNQPATEAMAPSFTSCNTFAFGMTPSRFKTATPNLKSIIAIPDMQMTPLQIDVWEHQAVANYFIRQVGTRIFVTVKDVLRTGGTALNGEFELVRSGDNGYLCPLDALGAQISGCTDAATPKNVFCTDKCFTVQSATATAGAAPLTFLLEGRVAPGVILFDGNLTLKFAPLSTASLLASGFIKTEGNTGKNVAPNFAGSSAGTAAGVSLPGVCSGLTSASMNLTPANFCKASGYDASAANKLGNVALMAGGMRRTVVKTTATYSSSDSASETSVPTTAADGRTSYVITKITPNAALGVTTTETITQQAYSGGDIQLAADNVIFGSIMAGNMLNTQGTTTIYGYVVSSALARAVPAGGGGASNFGGLGLTKNTLTSATNIDHSIKPANYEAGHLPGSSNGTPSPSGTGNDVRVLRSRYL